MNRSRSFARQLQDCLEQSYLLSDLYNNGNWIFDNYNYRTLSIGSVLMENGISITLNASRKGRDAKIDGRRANIEIKTTKVGGNTLKLHNVKGEFDKQNTEAQRDKLYAYDGVIFAAFEERDAFPRAMLYLDTSKGCDGWSQLVHEKQEAFLERWAESPKGRDSIAINAEEVIESVALWNQKKHCRGFIGMDEVGLQEFVLQLRDGLPISHGVHVPSSRSMD